MQPDVEGSEQKVKFYQGIGTVFPFLKLRKETRSYSSYGLSEGRESR